MVENVFRQKPLTPSEDGRHIPICIDGEPLVDERRGHAYIANTVHSSRYSVWDFLPRQLWFQSTRVHNLFFIIIGVPQCISGLSTTGNFTTILPLLVFMCFTIVKEGYDDYRRHRMDQVENKRHAMVLSGRSSSGPSRPWSAKSRLWSARVKKRIAEGSINAGDGTNWLRTEWRSVTVGDIVYLKRDEPAPADVVLLSTSGEDGLSFIETMNLDGETNLKSRRAPACLHQCHDVGAIRVCGAVITAQDPSPELHSFNGKVTVSGETHPLTIDNIILRGCVLRNTTHAIALVVRTGEECSIRMNANHHAAAKKPRLEKFANQAVLTLIAYVIIITAGLSLGYMSWQHNYEQNAFYLSNAPVGYQEVIIGYGIMFNNVIPLALYVSLEIVRIGQMLLMNSDMGLYDATTDTPMRCNTNTILENLGQVTHILSDKTGTLTENVMRFRKLSFAGLKFVHEGEQTISGEADVAVAKGEGGVGPSIMVTAADEGSSAEATPVRRSLSTRVPALSNIREVNGTTEDLIATLRAHPKSAMVQAAKKFLLGMALCHTCLPESRDGDTLYQAASPDEVALVNAAKALGFTVVERSSRTITLLINAPRGTATRETYDILDIIEFSSNRKRMSVIVRCPDGDVWLICKGADSVLVPLLQEAPVATEQARDVRKSHEADRRRYRKSMQERRASIGERVSFEVFGRHSSDAKAATVATRPVVMRAKSHEIKDPVLRLRHSLDIRPVSLDINRVPLSRLSLQGPRATPMLAATADPATVFKRCFEDIDDYANEGLRTLLFTHRCIDEDEYTAWAKLYNDASTSLVNREAKMEAVGAIIEQSLHLLGVTAIEDELQKGVPETIEKLTSVAKIFCLTGDKRETAISIAHSARICRPDSDVFILDTAKGDLEAQMRSFAVELESGSTHSVLVVDGQTLACIEAAPALNDHFYTFISFVDSVICCRASPSQKAGIVKGIRISTPEALTLAIGDGSNDIAMIQAAHVGVGISGKEGLQAYRAADYSIAQFRYLQRLLLVHGHWSYQRISRFILFTFWKEMLFYMPQALYQRYCGYTGTSLYESWSLTALNTLFTSLCVIVPGIFEQDLKAETLLAVPELYAYGQRNGGLNMRLYLIWMAGAAATGVIIWFIAWAAFGVFDTAGLAELFALGDLCFSTAIIWTNIKLLLMQTHYKTLVVGVAFTITFGGWWLWNLFLNFAYDPENRWPYNVRDGFVKHFGMDASWWTTLILTILVLALGELVPFICALLMQSHTVRRSIRRVTPKRWRMAPTNDAAFDTALWQKMEVDPSVQQRLRDLSDRDS